MTFKQKFQRNAIEAGAVTWVGFNGIFLLISLLTWNWFYVTFTATVSLLAVVLFIGLSFAASEQWEEDEDD